MCGFPKSKKPRIHSWGFYRHWQEREPCNEQTRLRAVLGSRVQAIVLGRRRATPRRVKPRQFRAIAKPNKTNR